MIFIFFITFKGKVMFKILMSLVITSGFVFNVYSASHSTATPTTTTPATTTTTTTTAPAATPTKPAKPAGDKPAAETKGSKPAKQ
jgi:hypothetical protein